jgi:hypothetical protein
MTTLGSVTPIGQEIAVPPHPVSDSLKEVV